jgi:hypothetical protein
MRIVALGDCLGTGTFQPPMDSAASRVLHPLITALPAAAGARTRLRA